MDSPAEANNNPAAETGPRRARGFEPARPVARVFFVAGGFVSVAVGVVGIVVPLLPTTPFFLLAAYCFARGSRRFNRWLHRRTWFQAYAARYLDGRGLPPHAKAATILILWVGLAVSALFITPSFLGRCALVVVGLLVTLHIAMIKPKHNPGQ